MTAITTTARAERATRRRPVPWTRLAWVTYRQHRPALTGAAVFLGLISVYLLIMGLRINHAYAAVATCHPAGSGVCRQLKDSSTTHTGAAAAAARCRPAARRPSPA